MSTRHSHILLTCFLGILLVSTVANGTISMVDDYWNDEGGDVSGYYASSNASAYADYDYMYQVSEASGGYSLQTSEGGNCEWWYYYEASAFAYVYAPQRAHISCSADASATGTYGSEISAYASAWQNNVVPPETSDWKYDDPDPHTDSGTDSFSAYDKISASHSVEAHALHDYCPTSNWATSDADAGAVIDLSEI